MKTENLSRKVLKSSAVVGGGLIIGFNLTGCSSEPFPVDTTDGSVAANAFLQIQPDNTVIFYCPRDEMGQGVTTGLGTLVCEELNVHPAKLEVKFPGVHADYANPAFGVQGTGGSSSIRAHWTQLRTSGCRYSRPHRRGSGTRSRDQCKRHSNKDAYVIAGGERYPYGQFVSTANLWKCQLRHRSN